MWQCVEAEGRQVTSRGGSFRDSSSFFLPCSLGASWVPAEWKSDRVLGPEQGWVELSGRAVTT